MSLKYTDVSEVRTAYIIKAMRTVSIIVSMTEAVRTSETSVYFETTPRCILEGSLSSSYSPAVRTWKLTYSLRSAGLCSGWVRAQKQTRSVCEVWPARAAPGEAVNYTPEQTVRVGS
jgi:hypothetical protein